MKKISIIMSVCLAILLSPVLVQAASNEWSDWYPVNQVYTYADGSVFVSLNPSSAHPNPNNCVSASWAKVEPTQVNVKELYQMALTAKAAGLVVNLQVSGTECSSSYPKLLSMRTR